MIKIELTTNHNDKMEGMFSCSTACTVNEQCLKNAAVPGSVCEKCYSFRMLKRFKNLRLKLERNSAALTQYILNPEEQPVINAAFFRFEAFGDIANETHFINYLNMCSKNPWTQFTIWTKSPHIMDAVFNDMGHKKPDNLIIIVSSLFINQAWNLDILPYAARYWFIDKIFTVYSADYIATHPEIEINCGARKCLSCLKCYTKNNIRYINELLK